MSFILDALKKSENERAHNAPPEFATVPPAGDAPRAPRWLWLLAALLAINVIALTALALRPDRETPNLSVAAEAPAQTAPATSASVAATDKFSDQLDEARRRRIEQSATIAPALDAPAENTPPVEAAETAPLAMRGDLPAADTRDQDTQRALLPSLTELRLDGSLQLPELHVDIHVYSDNPVDRFVFINMNKYRERDQLSEGPVVREIARDGVVLEHRGKTFMLPRE